MFSISICIFFLFLHQYTSSQHLLTSLSESGINNNNDNIVADVAWMQPPSYSNIDRFNLENNGTKESIELIPKYSVVYKAHNQNTQRSLSRQIRRANFWKRSNFL